MARSISPAYGHLAATTFQLGRESVALCAFPLLKSINDRPNTRLSNNQGMADGEKIIEQGGDREMALEVI